MSHHHSHERNHSHNHSHAHSDHGHGDPADISAARIKTLRWSMALTGLYLIAEVIGGYLSGSLALLADAGHMLADVAAIGLALFAAWICTQDAGEQKTYGFHRIEILAAFINGLALAGISFLIIYEAYHRFLSPEEVQGNLMMGVAIGGLIINIIVAKILHGDHEHDLNIKGAYLHVLGDLLGSIGAILAAGLIHFYGWLWADPLISVIISLLVLYSAFRLLIEATDILMENSPSHIDVKEVESAILALKGVQAIHDLHIWTISSGKHSLSAHVTVEADAYSPETLTRLQNCLKENFALNHSTIQLEPPNSEESCESGCSA